MAGWFESLSSFARGAAPALDRYTQLRQLDQENVWKRKLQQAQLDQYSQQSQTADIQQKSLERALLKSQFDDLTGQLSPGQNLSDATTQKLQGFDEFGGNDLVKAGTVYNPLQQVGNSVQLPGQQFGFSPTPGGEAPMAMTPLAQGSAPTTLQTPSFQMPDRISDTNKYMGTQQQNLDQYKATAPDRQRRLLMMALANVDPNDPRSLMAVDALSGTGQIDASKYLPKEATGDFAWLRQHPEDMAVYRQMHPIRPTGGSGANAQDSGMPLNDDNILRAAQTVLSGRMAPSQAATYYGGMGTQAGNWKRSIMNKVTELDPSYNFSEADSNYAFGKSPGTQTTIRFLDNITRTIPTMREAIAKLGMNNPQPVNWLELSARKMIGDKDVAKFNLLQLTLADEIAKVLQGGGTGSVTSDSKLKQASEMLNGSMTAGQWGTVLDTAQDVLAIRRKTLTDGTYMANAQFGSNDTAGNGGTVKIQTPRGDIVDVPVSQVEAALANHGKRVQ